MLQETRLFMPHQRGWAGHWRAFLCGSGSAEKTSSWVHPWNFNKKKKPLKSTTHNNHYSVTFVSRVHHVFIQCISFFCLFFFKFAASLVPHQFAWNIRQRLRQRRFLCRDYYVLTLMLSFFCATDQYIISMKENKSLKNKELKKSLVSVYMPRTENKVFFLSHPPLLYSCVFKYSVQGLPVNSVYRKVSAFFFSLRTF